jgi:hypothetical protein
MTASRRERLRALAALATGSMASRLGLDPVVLAPRPCTASTPRSWPRDPVAAPARPGAVGA